MSERQGEEVQSLQSLALPYGKEVELQQVTYENGFSVLRMRIREGKRFTTLDLDADTAALWGSLLAEWAGNTRSEQSE